MVTKPPIDLLMGKKLPIFQIDLERVIFITILELDFTNLGIFLGAYYIHCIV